MAKDEWAEALADLTGEQIKEGLEHCRKTFKWPPTPAEFIEKAEAGAPKTFGIDKALAHMPTRPAPEVLGRYAHETKEHYKKTGKTGYRRCVFSVGYGPEEYQRDLIKAKNEGKSLYEVDMAAMDKNGWTEEDEQGWRRHMMNLGHGINSMYPKGHAPDSREDHDRR